MAENNSIVASSRVARGSEEQAKEIAQLPNNGDEQVGNRQGGKKRKRRGDPGRNEWSRNQLGRDRTDTRQAAKQQKRDRRDDDSSARDHPFTQKEIESEERRPKSKMAVLIGYAGSGYKGMQINSNEKTIEGDLFAAFVAAGAISKANADDPKKSSLVRCARTDKGVHAAGNVISLKLITGDTNMVQKINENLPPQIRVWGMQRTTKSFSCYQLCDSRIYEYLIPTHAFLPPHPRTFLGKKIVEFALESDDLEGLKSRQEEVASFWDEVEESSITPVLDGIKISMRNAVLAAVHADDSATSFAEENGENDEPGVDHSSDPVELHPSTSKSKPEHGSVPDSSPDVLQHINIPGTKDEDDTAKEGIGDDTQEFAKAVRAVKLAYLRAKKAYRIDTKRLERIRETLQLYQGTKNYHNYTVDKLWRDPSSRRHIKSFVVAEDSPLIIGDTEWLSLKVHGQSFMMHQIRKMVSMAVSVVRCGCTPERLTESFQPAKVRIPKVPGIGLLLERPVFDSYNAQGAEKFQRPKIDFGNHEEDIKKFKQREIYDRIFRDEKAEN
ncbi:MAG: tRNA pseudouridine synthase 1 [Sclerophora amabilis]|nr:MAG: tRNA pseudouridine synthase 1 [Sclerophora amabilis]